MRIDEQIQTALRHQQAGKTAQAEEIYGQILAEQPNHAETLSLLATLALQRGEIEAAIDLLKRAVASKPDFAEAYRNLGALLNRSNRSDEAIFAYQKAITLRPTDARAHFDLGNVLLTQNQVDAAIAAYLNAIETKSVFSEAYNNLAIALRKKGQIAEAHAASDRASLLGPDFLERLSEISKILWKKNSTDEAIAKYLDVIRYSPAVTYITSDLARSLRGTEPDRHSVAVYHHTTAAQQVGLELHANMAILFAERERLKEAEAAYACAAELTPNAARTHEAMGKILKLRGDTAGAIKAFRRALAIDPDLVSSWTYLGAVLRSVGEFEEAAACFQRTVEMRPDLLVGFSNLASIRKLGADQPEIERLTALLDRHELSDDNRIAAEFALARSFDAAQRYDEAFSHFAAANTVAKRQHAEAGQIYDPKVVHEQIDALIDVFSTQYFQDRQAWGDFSELPVFVVGMPRSGTTLVQQIAGSHPQVHGAGELREIHAIAKELGGINLAADAITYTSGSINSAARQHLECIQALDAQALRIIDKMPSNVIRLGLIALLFPSARVVFCHRDPRDTCLSCYFQWFSEGNEFSFDLAHCGQEQLATDRLISHWRNILPLRMLHIQYEDVVADLEGQSRRLINFLGLPWDQACLDFHLNRSTVHTASVWQVRQPIYQHSVGRWRHYAKHLNPLFDVLDRR